jgi:hypothetical protein
VNLTVAVSPSLRKYLQERQVICQVSRDEKVSPHMLSGRASHALTQTGITQKMPDPECSPFYRMYRIAGYTIDNLIGNPSGRSTDNRLAFPHRL